MLAENDHAEFDRLTSEWPDDVRSAIESTCLHDEVDICCSVPDTFQ